MHLHTRHGCLMKWCKCIQNKKKHVSITVCIVSNSYQDYTRLIPLMIIPKLFGHLEGKRESLMCYMMRVSMVIWTKIQWK